MIYSVVAALALAATTSATLYTSDVSSQKHMWETFKREYNRNYGSMEEETQRFSHFLENLKIADLRNQNERKAGGSAIHGINKFSDLSQTEFARGYLTANPALKKNKVKSDGVVVSNTAATSKDWTGIYTTAIKDQGYCGGCWAFSATEQVESDSMRTLGGTQILSPEQVIQCDKTCQGCNGGWTEHGYDYIQNAGGQETEAAYPYTSYAGSTGSCKVNSKDFVVTVTGYTTIPGTTANAIETNMATYVLGTGPLSVCLDASTWSSYTSGIMSAATCGTSVDHCVQAVGVDTASGGYWKVRNQWGTSWGEAGYIRLQYGANACDITNDPTWTTVKAV